jgi:hypothetical protein
MGGDDPHRMPLDFDHHLQGTPPQRGGEGLVGRSGGIIEHRIPGLDGEDHLRKGLDRAAGAEGMAGQDGHPDAPAVGLTLHPMGQGAGQRPLQRLQRTIRADFLQGEHIGPLAVDHGGERGELGLEALAHRPIGVVLGEEQVLHVPAHQRETGHRLPR